ncbi:hypothetical protein P245_04340 [Comamonas thiooxydans]|uniref:Uncharacterized protein n=1 Tax=Comamonas thiooxydans TaxID=363952 RepID=A0A0E3BLT4_9BURK|nr:hypothetical protein P245_04340 [Comamonas thiooxydans]
MVGDGAQQPVDEAAGAVLPQKVLAADTGSAASPPQHEEVAVAAGAS